MPLSTCFAIAVLSTVHVANVSNSEPGVAWYGSWDTALVEAERSQRPIMLEFARVSCQGVSGVFCPGYTITEEREFTPEFIEATRNFVCVRLDAYENEKTMAMVKRLNEGELLNTAFAVFAPDGETKLTKQSRSMRFAFDVRSVPKGLIEIARQYPGVKMKEPAHTPDFSSLREAVNASACDERPLVIAWASDSEQQTKLEQALRPLAWRNGIVGRFHWDFATSTEIRELIKDAPVADCGVIVVQSEPFGRNATVIGTIDVEQPLADQCISLLLALKDFDSSFAKLPYKEHVELGKNLGVEWEEAIKMGERPMDDKSRRRNRRSEEPDRGDRRSRGADRP